MIPIEKLLSEIKQLSQDQLWFLRMEDFLNYQYNHLSVMKFDNEIKKQAYLETVRNNYKFYTEDVFVVDTCYLKCLPMRSNPCPICLYPDAMKKPWKYEPAIKNYIAGNQKPNTQITKPKEQKKQASKEESTLLQKMQSQMKLLMK